MVKKIYLHWTAGRYDQFFNDYHICIDGDGVVHKMADFETKLTHTWHRNSNAVGIVLCCCYGAKTTLQSRQSRASSPRQGSHEPSLTRDLNEVQWTSEPKHVLEHRNMRRKRPAKLGEGLIIDWGEYPPTKEQILSMAHCVADICKQYNLPVNKETVMTHAEVADMDGYGLHDNDPDLRWDLLRLPGHSNAVGGEVIRRMALAMLNNEVAIG